MNRSVHVAGVGLAPFIVPQPDTNAALLGAHAASAALADASLNGSLVQRALVASANQGADWPFAATCAAEMAGIPAFRVSPDDIGGAQALCRAREAVAKGSLECALVLGVQAGGACSKPSGAHVEAPACSPCTEMRLIGARKETFARIAGKARLHAARNPLAPERRGMELSEIPRSDAFEELLVRLTCSVPRAGAAAAVLCSADFARRHRLDKRVSIAAQGVERMVGGDDVPRASECAARKAYAEAGVGPEHLDLVELHDDCAASELLAYESLHLVPKGSAEQFVLDGENTYGGLVVTNPSGGLLGLGNAGAANALAQCTELVWQLRGAARLRQVDGARTALQHSVDHKSGTCVVTLYRAEER
ncbi:Acetyl-CoA acetyltransferase [Variovorax sp. HW608]|nr:Acetyl-CoA acetyltransferase [Variovorax sp. HW608]